MWHLRYLYNWSSFYMASPAKYSSSRTICPLFFLDKRETVIETYSFTFHSWKSCSCSYRIPSPLSHSLHRHCNFKCFHLIMKFWAAYCVFELVNNELNLLGVVCSDVTDGIIQGVSFLNSVLGLSDIFLVGTLSIDTGQSVSIHL